MATNSENGSLGCGCIIMLALACAILKFITWLLDSPPNEAQTAKKVGLISIVSIVILCVLIKWSGKRRRIKHWEKSDLAKWLSDNRIERSLSNAEAVVKKAKARCDAAQAQFPAVRRNLIEFHNREENFS